MDFSLFDVVFLSSLFYLELLYSLFFNLYFLKVKERGLITISFFCG